MWDSLLRVLVSILIYALVLLGGIGLIKLMTRRR
jgi:hypothetical protein